MLFKRRRLVLLLFYRTVELFFSMDSVGLIFVHRFFCQDCILWSFHVRCRRTTARTTAKYSFSRHSNCKTHPRFAQANVSTCLLHPRFLAARSLNRLLEILVDFFSTGEHF